MSNFLMDKAFMALKSKRYEEAQSTYEKILEQGYTVSAWCGLGSCKMFQLADGQTLEEVVYCYNKAYSLPDADKLEIDKILIENVNVVLTQYAAYAIAGIKNAIKAEKDATNAAIIGIASVALGSMTSSSNLKAIGGIAAGVSGAVAVGKFGEMKDMKEIAKYCANMISNTHNEVKNLLLENNNIEEAITLNNNVNLLSKQVLDALPKNMQSIAIGEENFEDLNSDVSSLSLCNKYAINHFDIYYAAIVLKKQSELGFLSAKKEKYKSINYNGIRKKYDISFMDYGNLLKEIEKSKIAESNKWITKFPNITVEL